jgi:dihydrofolate reductase
MTTHTATERKVVLLMGMSLDGFGAWGWSPPAASAPDRDAIHDEIRHQLTSIDTFLLGRTCYQLWETFWPSMAHSATSSPFEKEFSRITDEMQKVVYSKTLTKATWQNTRLANGSLADDVAYMKQTPGRDLAIIGGPTIARAFGDMGLIDEYRVWIHPTLLGTGTPLLGSNNQRRDLELLGVRTFGNSGSCFHLRPRPAQA